MTDTDERPLLCVIAPCFNEQEVVVLFCERLMGVLDTVDDIDYRILFVDDGSSDSTLGLLNELAASHPRLLVVSLSRNFGHQTALTAGLAIAEGDAVMVMDSDLQHPPALIPEMVQRWRDGHDVVLAVRKSTAGASIFRRFSSRTFYWLLNHLSDTPIVSGAADFFLLSQRAHRALRSMPEHHRFLRGLVSWIGFPRATVPYEAPPRSAGRSKYNRSRMIGLALDAVFSFSVTPIRVMTRLGMFVSLLGLFYFGYVLVRKFAYGDLVRGWGSLISVVLILGGLQLAFMGVIGQYLARVFEEVKQRPSYLFKQEVASERFRQRSRPR